MRLVSLIAAVILAFTSSAFDPIAHPTSTFAQDSDLPGIETAMLPTLFPVSHAANLLTVRSGDVLCFWFSGSEEGASGVGILMSRLGKGAKRWQPPVLVDRESGKSYQNPVPFEAPNGDIWLLHTSQTASKGQADAQVMKVVSTDGGNHWSAPKVLFSQAGSYIRQRIVEGDHGELLLPLYYSTSSGITAGADTNYSSVKVSRDMGLTWTECTVPQSEGLVQMNIIRLATSKYIAFFRSRYADNIYGSGSSDGCHWAPPSPTPLPNNNASIQAVQLKNADIVMAFDNASGTLKQHVPQTGPRFPLSIALSKDGGASWVAVRDLEVGASPNRRETAAPAEEYSYPSIEQLPSGKILVAYTYRRQSIKAALFNESWIEQGKTTGAYRPETPKTAEKR
jgi:predicted neuraminidase